MASDFKKMRNMMETKIFNSSKNNEIRYRLFNSEQIGKKDLIIIVHGFKGFMDWGFFPVAAEYFSSLEFPVLTFNFSHNGVEDDLLNFTRLDKFALNTYSLEVDELNDVITAYEKDYFGNTDNYGIHLIGHSRGGLSVVLNSVNVSVKSFTTWAGVAKIDRFSERQKDEWRKAGEFSILNSRTNQNMKMTTNLLDDIENNSESKLNMKKVLNNNLKPYLIIQGEQDLAVKVAEAELLYNWNNKNAELVVLPGTGHTFDMKHPCEEISENFTKVLNLTYNFFKDI